MRWAWPDKVQNLQRDKVISLGPMAGSEQGKEQLPPPSQAWGLHTRDSTIVGTGQTGESQCTGPHTHSSILRVSGDIWQSRTWNSFVQQENHLKHHSCSSITYCHGKEILLQSAGMAYCSDPGQFHRCKTQSSGHVLHTQHELEGQRIPQRGEMVPMPGTKVKLREF